MDVLDSIKPVLHISRVLGIAPFRFKHNTLKRSRCLSRYSAILIAVDVFLMCLFSANNILHHSSTFVEALTSACHWLVLTLNALLTSLIISRNKDAMRMNLVKMNEFLKSRLKAKQLKALRYWTVAYSLSAITHCTLFVTVYCVETRKRVFLFPGLKPLSYTAMSVVIFMVNLWCVQFVVCSWLIRLCYIAVNHKLFPALRKTVARPRFQGINHLRSLMVTHHHLTDIADETASIFSIYFLAITVLVFVETLFTFTHYRNSHGWLSGTFNSIWLSYYVIQFAAVVVVSVATSTQAEKTANYLHELFIDNDDPELKEEIEIFSLQLLHRKVEFNACGFFKLDFSLLYSMVGAVTTYIIILMQFQGNNAVTPGNCTAIKCHNCTMAS